MDYTNVSERTFGEFAPGAKISDKDLTAEEISYLLAVGAIEANKTNSKKDDE